MLPAGAIRSGHNADVPRNQLITWFCDKRASNTKRRGETYSTLEKKNILQSAFNTALPEEQATAVSLVLGDGVPGRFEPAVRWAVAYLAAKAALTR